MFKRILLVLALAVSLGGGVLACNTPAATTSPASVTPASPGASDMMSNMPSMSGDPLMSMSPSAS